MQVRVTGVQTFESFEAMIKECTIKALLPDHQGDVASAVKTYRSFGTRRGKYADLEEQHGAVAMTIMPLYDDLVIPAISSDYESDSSEF